MDNTQFPGQGGKWDTVVGFACGGISALWHSIYKVQLLQINWHDYWVHLLAKSIEVAVVALFGGAMGLIGKKIVEKYLFKKPKV